VYEADLDVSVLSVGFGSFFTAHLIVRRVRPGEIIASDRGEFRGIFLK